jgi:hypothetical protein
MATAHSVLLGWTASVDPVDGYNVYRGTVGPGSETTTPINPALIVGTTYTDTTVTEGETLDYYVKSSKGGLLSIPSNEVSAVILPAPPTGLTAKSS